MDIQSWERRAESLARIARSHTTYDDTINIFLEGALYMPKDCSAEVQAAEMSSDQYQLRKTLLQLAHDHCSASGLQPGTTEALSIFEHANDVANAITDAYWLALPYRTDEKLALTPQQVKEKLALVVPSYVQNLVHHVKEHGKLSAQQDGISAGVGIYVKSYFKAEDIDRVLLQALTQIEMVAYIDEMTWKNERVG